MLYYFNVDENQRITGLSTSSKDGEFVIHANETDEVVTNPFIFKYVEGQLYKDLAYQKQLVEEKLNRINVQYNNATDSELLELKLALADLAEVILGGK